MIISYTFITHLLHTIRKFEMDFSSSNTKKKNVFFAKNCKQKQKQNKIRFRLLRRNRQSKTEFSECNNLQLYRVWDVWYSYGPNKQGAPFIFLGILRDPPLLILTPCFFLNSGFSTFLICATNMLNLTYL